MTKMKTVLAVFTALALADNAYSQSRRIPRGLQRRSVVEASSTASKEEGQYGIPGVTAPFVPFEEKDKIKYEDAVERAKKNDAEAFYWLAYYFLKGEGVTKDSTAAGKFLQKAVDAGNAKACYLTGLYHECYSLEDERGQSLLWGTLLTEKESEEMWNVLGRAKIDYGSFSLQMPKADGSDDSQAHGFLRRPRFSRRGGNTINCCCTNDIAVAHVIGLYSTAIKGGLTYATNDIARLKRAIAKCREHITAEIEAKDKGAEALNLLVDEDAKKVAVAKQKEFEAKQKKDEERRRQYEERQLEYEKYEKECDYWSSWPRTLSNEEMTLLDVDFEKKFNCVFLKPNSRRLGLMRPGARNVSANSRANTWVMGCGKSLIVFHGANNEFFQKVDSNGLTVAWGWSNNETDLEELKWYAEEKERRLVPLRAKWAEEHGMTLEEAMQKYKAWQEQIRKSPPPQPNRLLRLNNRPGLNAPPPDNRQLSGLEIARMRRKERLERQQADEEQQRQAAEQAKKEREQEAEARKQAAEERKQLAEERKAQLDQLMQIQEELRRQREEKLREQNNMK